MAYYSGCLSDLSFPGEIAYKGGELSMLFDQAEVADETPEILHVTLGIEEVLDIELHTLHACMGEQLMEHLLEDAMLEVSDEEVEAIGYMGWAHHGNVMHL